MRLQDSASASWSKSPMTACRSPRRAGPTGTWWYNCSLATRRGDWRESGIMTSDDDLNYELCWVHISDIHETGEPGADNEHRQLVFQRLTEDLDRRAEIGDRKSV